MSELAAVHLVDDDQSFLSALSRLLRTEGFCVGAFPSATEFLAHVSADVRGCVVADLSMPDITGLELQTMLANMGVTMPVVFLTGRGDIPSTVRAMRSGAVDFLEKNAPKEQLIAAIGQALERDATEQVERGRLRELERRFAQLTHREREVLQYVVHGKMNKEIAATLGINIRTVKLHRTAITTKVGVHSAARLATLTREAQLFERELPAGLLERERPAGHH